MSAEETVQTQPAKRKPLSPGLRWAREIVVILVTAIVISFMIKTFLVRPFYIPSGSMEQTLKVGDRIFANEIGPKFTGIHKGDIVVFKDTQGWLPEGGKKDPGPIVNTLAFIGLMPDPSNDYLIKRVIGTAGDHVVCCDAQGKVSVNGKVLNESYAVPSPESAQIPFDVVVPQGSLWVMGDNRPNSADSRFHQNLPSRGFVSLNDVVGTAWVVVWPLNRIKVLDSGGTTY